MTMRTIQNYKPTEEDVLKMLILFKITQLKQTIKTIHNGIK